MNSTQLFGLVGMATLCLAFPAESAHRSHGKFAFGIQFGVPLHTPHCHYRPYYAPRYYSVIRPAPVYYYTQPRVIVQPAPIVVQQPNISPYSAPAPTLTTAPPIQQVSGSTPPSSAANDGWIQQQLSQLTNSSEKVRSEAVMALGRTKAHQAVNRLNAVLAGDKSPMVRDAAARALGLIGSPSALPALTYAAQADSDRDVRHSARFAVEVIQANRPK